MVIKTARPVAVLAPLNNRRIPKQNSTTVFFIIYNFFDEWKCTFFTVNTNNSVDCVFITTSSKKIIFKNHIELHHIENLHTFVFDQLEF
jgi:hypothetical protein